MEHRAHQFLFLSIIVGAVGALLILAEPMVAGNAKSAGGFQIQSSPSPNHAGDTFLAAAAISSNDVWAVGYQGVETEFNDAQTLTEHWNGANWTVVSSPNPNPGGCHYPGNALNGVSAVSHTDVWAVGFSDQDQLGCSELKPLILNWNGGTWRVVSSPGVNNNGNSVLNGTAALASNNVYAVGYQAAVNGAQVTLVENWNGREWQVVSTPNANSQFDSLNAIAATSSYDIWAVGVAAGPVPFSSQTLILHFDGTQWSIVPSPNPLPLESGNENTLLAVTAISPTDATAVGESFNGATYAELTVIEHWDGRSWSVVPSPNVYTSAGAINTLNGVVTLTSSNVYAAGYFTTPYEAHPLVEHFNGTEWSVISTPTKGAAQSLNAIASVPKSSFIWTVGAYSSSGWDYEYHFLYNPATFVLFMP